MLCRPLMVLCPIHTTVQYWIDDTVAIAPRVQFRPNCHLRPIPLPPHSLQHFRYVYSASTEPDASHRQAVAASRPANHTPFVRSARLPPPPPNTRQPSTTPPVRSARPAPPFPPRPRRTLRPLPAPDPPRSHGWNLGAVQRRAGRPAVADKDTHGKSSGEMLACCALFIFILLSLFCFFFFREVGILHAWDVWLRIGALTLSPRYLFSLVVVVYVSFFSVLCVSVACPCDRVCLRCPPPPVLLRIDVLRSL